MLRAVRRSVFVLILLAGVSGTALAHGADLLRSEPIGGARLAESPDEVMTWFSEELVSQRSRLTVYNSLGEAIGHGGVDLSDPDHASMMAPLPSLTDGIYTIFWQVVLLDGDQTTGTISFSVGEPDPGEKAFDPTATSTSNEFSQTAVFTIVGLIVIIGVGMLVWRRRAARPKGA